MNFRWVVRARPDYIPQEELGHVIRSEIVGAGSPDNPGEQGRVPRVWMRHGPFADSFQVATRAALDALGSAYTELKACRRRRVVVVVASSSSLRRLSLR